MKQLLATFVSSLLFGYGLAVAGMTKSENVIGFLDITGEWKPALMFVMVGAIGVHMGLYRYIVKRPTPILAQGFSIPTKKELDKRLILGSALFGIGWGAGGFCPGPGLTSLSTGMIGPTVFVVSMIGGMLVFRTVLKWIS